MKTNWTDLVKALRSLSERRETKVQLKYADRPGRLQSTARTYASRMGLDVKTWTYPREKIVFIQRLD